MPSLLDLSAELQVAIIEYLDTPATRRDPPAAYFAPRTSRDVANLSACCRFLRRLAAPTLYRKIHLRSTDKSGKSLQAVGDSARTAGLVRELNFEAIMTIDDDWDDRLTLSEEDFPASTVDVLTHLKRFPNLEVLSVQFKLGETEGEDFEGALSAFEQWRNDAGPPRDLNALKRLEETAEWRAVMAKTYDSIADSERPSTLTTLELRNLLPSGVSSFNTEPWQAFLRTLKTFRISLHGHEGGCGSSLSTAWGYFDLVRNLDLVFSQLANVTELRFVASRYGLPGLPGQHHTALPLNVEDMPLLQVLEMQFCFVSERIARFIGSHIKTLKRVRLEDCYSAASDYNTEEHTTWATFLSIIANSLDAAEDPPLEEFFISPRKLGKSRWQGGHDGLSVPIQGDEQQVELAWSMSRAEPHRRPFDYAKVDDKYGFLSKEEEQNLNAFLSGHDQAAFDRVMAIIGRKPGGKQKSV